MGEATETDGAVCLGIMTGNITTWTIKPIKLENGFATSAGAFNYWIRLIKRFEIRSLPVVSTCVSFSGYDADIGWSVVRFNAVNVVNLFIRGKRPSEDCFRNKSMLVNVTVLHRAFVFWAKKLNVTVGCDNASTRNKSRSPFNIILTKHFKDRTVSDSNNGRNFSRRQTGLIE